MARAAITAGVTAGETLLREAARHNLDDEKQLHFEQEVALLELEDAKAAMASRDLAGAAETCARVIAKLDGSEHVNSLLQAMNLLATTMAMRSNVSGALEVWERYAETAKASDVVVEPSIANNIRLCKNKLGSS
jgi:hypothetical protein